MNEYSNSKQTASPKQKQYRFESMVDILKFIVCCYIPFLLDSVDIYATDQRICSHTNLTYNLVDSESVFLKVTNETSGLKWSMKHLGYCLAEYMIRIFFSPANLRWCFLRHICSSTHNYSLYIKCPFYRLSG